MNIIACYGDTDIIDIILFSSIGITIIAMGIAIIIAVWSCVKRA